ncbi:hypothetical protein SAMN02800692_2025 [Luteibacter sp. UNC138MFCol5.1]|uniref:hypothetical protein n=1 Tax=Luteibacter sp. UNC138MFCol5.1 TaxID=1502774 RepID=UPI0008D79E00|nr:hypothetical protein [Luteibacter sp. UNC138MFCol5.1]SEO76898.1 hypothetical protein SAMN02800692_2025 [Luteibacter sp. UNC138MFCol5.1]
MSLTFVSANSPAFAAGVRIGGQAVKVNDLLAELEADTATPDSVLVNVRLAYELLNQASLHLFERAIDVARAKGHYTAMAAEAAGGVLPLDSMLDAAHNGGAA